MGLLSDLGAKGVEGSINFTGIGTTIGIILIGFFVLIFVGGGIFLYYLKKSKKVVYKNQIPFFVKALGKLSRTSIDHAREIFIPNTNISLFYLKDKKIYTPRPTRNMGMNEFWYYISENGELVNFDLSCIPGEDTFAQINYDHRDTRYAFVNLQDILQKNYKDKSIKWWKDPTIMNIISFVIMSIVFVVAIIIVLARFGTLLEKLLPISENFVTASENMAKAVQISQNLNSGVAPVI